MQIDFSPNQVPAPRANGGLQSRTSVSGASNVTDFQGSADLLRKLKALPDSRPEKIAAAQQAISDVQYPPDQLLNSIAHLLAISLGS